MLEFYEFNTVNIIVVLVSTFIIYYIMSNYLGNNDSDKKKTKGNQFSLEYLIISVIIAVSISLIVAYIMSSGDESVLTDNYWDPIVDIQTVGE
jgi:O-antigen/teichoic acid export membrane protein